MMTLNEKNREEISLLLPWYVAGTLNTEEQTLVENALQVDAVLREELQLVQADQNATLELIVEDEAEVPASMQARFDTAMRHEMALAQRSAARSAAQNVEKTSLFSRLFASLLPQGNFAYAAIAAAVVIALQTGAIVTLVNNNTSAPAQYETASGTKTSNSKDLFVLVRFTNSALIGDISAYLDENGGEIAEGPLPGRMFRLRFSPEFAVDADALAKKIVAKQTLFDLVLAVK